MGSHLYCIIFFNILIDFLSCRLDDQLLLERYRMMQPGLFGAYAPPGMMGHHGVHPLLQAAAGAGRYPAELLSQQHLPSYMAAAAGAKLPEHISPGLDR